jgi:hypothetical protein
MWWLAYAASGTLLLFCVYRFLVVSQGGLNLGGLNLGGLNLGGYFGESFRQFFPQSLTERILSSADPAGILKADIEVCT